MKKITFIAVGLIAYTGLTQAYAEQGSQNRPAVAEFLASCLQPDPLSQASCDQPIHINILAIGLAQVSKREVDVCLPRNPNRKSWEKLRSSIVTWLTDRPEIAGEEASNGVYKAMKEIYPCR